MTRPAFYAAAAAAAAVGAAGWTLTRRRRRSARPSDAWAALEHAARSGNVTLAGGTPDWWTRPDALASTLPRFPDRRY